MKNLKISELEKLKGGYSATQCFFSVPSTIFSSGALQAYNAALLIWCWNN